MQGSQQSLESSRLAHTRPRPSLLLVRTRSSQAVSSTELPALLSTPQPCELWPKVRHHAQARLRANTTGLITRRCTRACLP